MARRARAPRYFRGAGGKTDDLQLAALTAYLRDTHGIDRNRIRKDWFLLIDRYDYAVIGVTEHVTERQISEQNPLVHHPDIVLLGENLSDIACIIELDGAVHHTGPGMRKTARRNANYEAAGIPLIIIDIMDLRLVGRTWFEHLDAELAERKII